MCSHSEIQISQCLMRFLKRIFHPIINVSLHILDIIHFSQFTQIKEQIDARLGIDCNNNDDAILENMVNNGGQLPENDNYGELSRAEQQNIDAAQANADQGPGFKSRLSPQCEKDSVH